MNFNNPDFDRIFSAALVENDDDRRISLYKEAQRIISENAADVFIQDIMGFGVYAIGRFGGFVTYPIHVMDFAPIYRR